LAGFHTNPRPLGELGTALVAWIAVKTRGFNGNSAGAPAECIVSLLKVHSLFDKEPLQATGQALYSSDFLEARSLRRRWSIKAAFARY